MMPHAFCRRPLLLLLAATAVIVPTVAMQPGPQFSPPVVATVDLERVFNEIDRLNQAQTGVEQALKPLQDQRDHLRQEAERLKADLDMLVAGTPKYDEAEAAWTQAVVEYKSMVAFIEAKVDSLRAQARMDIFGTITDAAAKFAQQRGLDFIITNDSGIALQQGTDAQVVQQLALRRVVYANPTLDVTNDLINWINANGN